MGTSQSEQSMETTSLTFRLLYPFRILFRSGLMEQTGGNLAAQLERAGLGWTPAQFMTQKLGLAGILIFFGLFFSIGNPDGLREFFIKWIPLSIIGYSAPGMRVKSRIKSYEDKLMAEFPDFIDATRGYLSTGMSIFQTIKQVKCVTGPTLTPLIEKLGAELEVYDQITALRKFGQRAGIIEAENFVVAVEQGISAGIPLKDIFANQSSLIRDLRKLQLKLKIKKKPIYLALVGGLLFINIFIIVGLPATITIMSIRGLN
ncbi:MAG TPA: hypothetical protein VHS59_04040 [Bacillota bacterium]|nr:hypothetical protein [Bacillota bacterium]